MAMMKKSKSDFCSSFSLFSRIASYPAVQHLCTTVKAYYNTAKDYSPLIVRHGLENAETKLTTLWLETIQPISLQILNSKSNSPISKHLHKLDDFGCRQLDVWEGRAAFVLSAYSASWRLARELSQPLLATKDALQCHVVQRAVNTPERLRDLLLSFVPSLSGKEKREGEKNDKQRSQRKQQQQQRKRKEGEEERGGVGLDELEREREEREHHEVITTAAADGEVSPKVLGVTVTVGDRVLRLGGDVAQKVQGKVLGQLNQLDKQKNLIHVLSKYIDMAADHIEEVAETAGGRERGGEEEREEGEREEEEHEWSREENYREEGGEEEERERSSSFSSSSYSTSTKLNKKQKLLLSLSSSLRQANRQLEHVPRLVEFTREKTGLVARFTNQINRQLTANMEKIENFVEDTNSPSSPSTSLSSSSPSDLNLVFIEKEREEKERESKFEKGEEKEREASTSHSSSSTTRRQKHKKHNQPNNQNQKQIHRQKSKEERVGLCQ